MDKKTPLYDVHEKLGGKIVPFGGYLLPVQYGTGVITEHMAVRTRAGLFDVSHMAELMFEGPDAVANIQRLCTTDIAFMTDGQVKYAMMCNEKGGIVDDLVIYRMKEDKYMLVVNAGNHEKDAAWVETYLSGDVKYEDISESLAQIALQGPESEGILRKLCDDKYIPHKYYHFIENGVADTSVRKIDVLISRTGYTGEHGFELYCKAEDAVDLWNALLLAGSENGLIPCGLGARDTLRLEASMPLYGHEMNDDISPVEAGLPCRLDGKDFIGKQAIISRGIPSVRRVGLRITGRGIAREQCPVLDSAGNVIGHVSSGTFCPFLGFAAAMAYVPAEGYGLGTIVTVDVRGRTVEAVITGLPFYKISQ